MFEQCSGRIAPAARAAILTAVCLAACDHGSPTAPVPPVAVPTPLEAVIEALFLASGPASEGTSHGRLWASYPPGGRARLVIGASVNPAAAAALRRQVEELDRAFGGYFHFEAVASAEPEPQPATGEITIYEVPQSVIAALSGEAEAGGLNQIVRSTGPVLDSSRCLIAAGSVDPDTYVHEVGHGLGFQHIRDGYVPAMMNPSAPVMDFSELELEAIRKVYAAHLLPGATRDDFVRAGLLDATSGGSSAAPQ
jgi:hypothetical protein